MQTSLEQLMEAANEVSKRYLGLQGAIEVRNRLIVSAHQDGVAQVDLALAAGLSPQRINQLVYDSEEPDNGQPH